ncbi:MAG: hypothetical protein LBT54_04480 [Bifidobacteriaceae bacterium]|jgi:hypothetical protein|nr:hypothetical protein [Bifidobacteriaceae bacterium]
MNYATSFARWVQAAPPVLGEGPAILAASPLADNEVIAPLLKDQPATCFVPEDDPFRLPPNARATIIPYSGAFAEPGDNLELTGGTRFLLESYRAAPFLAQTAATVLAVFSSEDHAAFLDDADAAFNAGQFEASLLHPSVIFADSPALGGPARPGGAAQARLYLDREGVARAGLRGSQAACLADVAAWTRGDLLGQVAGAVTAERSLAARPWLGRYLQAIACLAAIPRDGAAPRVSGFAWSLAGDDAGPVLDPAAPLIVGLGERHVVWLPASGRAFAVSRDVATITDHIARAAAGRELDPLHAVLGTTSEAAARARGQVHAHFFAAAVAPVIAATAAGPLAPVAA